MTNKDIVKALRAHAEWASANEWETPITLGDDLTAAADLIENQQNHIRALLQANEALRERQRWIAKADKEGSVVVLPCKVGDAYYTIECFCSEDGYYDEKQLHHSWDCEYCSLDNCDKEHRVVEHIFQSERSIYEKKGWLGECAWLTREEAEEALRRMDKNA